MAGPRCRASTQWALALAVVLVTTAQAYPALWAEEANSCTEHPDKKGGCPSLGPRPNLPRCCLNNLNATPAFWRRGQARCARAGQVRRRAADAAPAVASAPPLCRQREGGGEPRQHSSLERARTANLPAGRGRSSPGPRRPAPASSFTFPTTRRPQRRARGLLALAPIPCPLPQGLATPISRAASVWHPPPLPVPPSTAKFTITSEGAPATLACPGGTYTVKVWPKRRSAPAPAPHGTAPLAAPVPLVC
jgi:hypothetical protein